MEIAELYKLYQQHPQITTDSRDCPKGSIFLALKGESFDGNQFAASALEKGCAYAIIDDKSVMPDGDNRFILVDNCLQTFKDLAREHRRQFDIPVIGITGTNGKTTTKELVAAVLSQKFNVLYTQGNFNNDVGVPKTLFRLTKDHEIAVIEMGASHPDDIAKLVKVSQPDYGLITNVGRAHLLGFGSFEGVKAAKGELYNWLGAHRGSLIFLNEDDPDLREMAAKQPCHTFGYGIDYQHAEILPATPQEPFLRIRLGDALVVSHLVGAYNATNILAALAVGEYFGVPRADAIAAIAEFVPDNNRSQMVRTAANTLIVDAYNANPSSMRAALENFGHVEAAHKLALLGDMRELGAESVEEHKKIVLQLRETGIPACLVGEEFQKALSALPGDEAWFPTSEALAAHLKDHSVSGAMILVKGSRGIQMEKVIPTL